MLRNLRQPKGSPSRPTRVCRNSTGPPSCSFTASAVAAINGASSTNRHSAPSTSKARLAHREAWRERQDSRWTNGRPATGRTLQALARDVGQARYDDRLDRQSFQLPGRPPELLGGPEGAFGEQDDVGGVVRHDGRRGVGVTEDRDAGCGLRRAHAGRGERSQHGVPQPRLTAQHGRHLVDVSRVPGDDELLAEVAAHLGPLDHSPQSQAAQDDERRTDGESEEEEAAREREAGQVTADADQTGAEHRRPDDPLVLLGPGPEDLPGIPADTSQHGEPPQQERSRCHEHEWRRRRRAHRRTAAPGDQASP